MRAGKIGPAQPVEMPAPTVPPPSPVVVDLAAGTRKREDRRRTQGSTRGNARGGQRTRTGRPPRERKQATVTPITAAREAAAAPVEEQQQRPKKRRRPRKRSRKPTQRTEQPPLTLETADNGNGVADTVEVSANGDAAAATPRKKSRRGRRGGRGRKRGPRPNAEVQLPNNGEIAPDNAGEAAS